MQTQALAKVKGFESSVQLLAGDIASPVPPPQVKTK